MSGRRGLHLAGLLLLAVLPACSSSSSGAAAGRLRVVASTDVYADIARAIGGDRVEMSAFIAGAGQDPHTYEATARDQLAVARADVVIENGGGYDDFMTRMRSASGKRGATLVDVVQLSGKVAPVGGELNEHVWYDLSTVRRLVARLAAVLSARQPAGAAAFRANATRFDRGLSVLQRTAAEIRASHSGQRVAITEPVPLYLLSACGLVDQTPSGFSAAIEAGTEVPPAVLKQTLDLFSPASVRALIYNAQTTGPETTQLLAAAEANAIPAVAMTETLPAGIGYLAWMRANLAAIQRVLAA